VTKTTSISDLYKPGRRRGSAATIRLSDAYRAVFINGNPSKEDSEIVMSDLANFSGYFSVSPPGTSDADLREANGARAVFARILSLSELPLVQLRSLREAALVELQTDSEEGN
jgi:hypothetical protein